MRALSLLCAAILLSSAVLLADDHSELDNPLFVKKLRATMRTALLAKGLTEVANQPDLFVDFTLSGEDVAVGTPSSARGIGPQPVRFTVGALVIEMTKPGGTKPIWQGVYRDDEDTGSKLMQKLPDDVKKLIDRYPHVK